jgi:iron complex outermembrane receptor protein
MRFISRKGLRPALVLAAGAGCLSGVAQAQSVDPFALSPEQLFDATVTSASRTAENLKDVSAAIYVITGEDIARAGATSIAEALRLAPGVNVARAGTSSWAISIRGFNSALANKLLVLIDGREVYDPLFSGVYWDVQDTLLEDIDRIEIIRGPGASLWGANAVNGVINIITKKSDATLGALATVVAGDKEKAGLSARYGGKWGERATWRVYAKYADRAHEDQLITTGEDWETSRGGFRYDWGGGTQTFTLQGDVYGSQSTQERLMPLLTKPYARLQPDYIDADGGNILGRWSRTAANDSRFVVQAYRDRTDRSQATINEKRTTYDIDTQYEFATLGPHKIMIGAGYRKTRDKFATTSIVAVANGGYGVEEERLSGFIQDRIALSSQWQFTIGSKFEDNAYTGSSAQPNARLQWRGDNDTIWVAASRALRTPSELERKLNVLVGVAPPSVFPVPTSIELIPSPTFDNEELIAYELGYRRDWGSNVETDVTLFHNKYHGLATLTLTPFKLATNPLHLILPIVTTNNTAGASSGFEAVANWRPSEAFNVSASYSYIDLELTGPPANLAIASEAAETLTPNSQANIRAQWNISSRLSADANLYYVDAIPGFGLDAYTRADLRLGWRLTDAVQAELVGQNLFDASHREFNAATNENATDITRSAFLRLTWRQ